MCSRRLDAFCPQCLRVFCVGRPLVWVRPLLCGAPLCAGRPPVCRSLVGPFLSCVPVVPRGTYSLESLSLVLPLPHSQCSPWCRPAWARPPHVCVCVCVYIYIYIYIYIHIYNIIYIYIYIYIYIFIYIYLFFYIYIYK